jgi:hypothetical protein
MVFNQLDHIFQKINCYSLMTNGDKQMLMKMLRDGYREMTAEFESERLISTVATQRPAANASSFTRTDSQSSPQRRRGRLNRSMTTNLNGWTVRTW